MTSPERQRRDSPVAAAPGLWPFDVASDVVNHIMMHERKNAAGARKPRFSPAALAHE
ncbi:MAG TPA: hypothetical protein VMF69_10540 [Gemmataceae bacterium]|nr:hypothetical protein [Gemmataceae bacterium]